MMIRTLALPGLDLDGRTSLLARRGNPSIADQFDHQTLMSVGGLGALGFTSLETASHPEILSAVQAAIAARGWHATCVENKNANPYAEGGYLFNRVCSVPGGSGNQYDADLIYTNPEGIDVGVQISMANEFSAGGSLPTGYNPQAPIGAENTPGSTWTPVVMPYTGPAVNTPPPTHTPPAQSPAPASTSSNPAPQTTPTPTVQPGVVNTGTPPAINITLPSQNGTASSSLLGGIDTNTLLIIGAAVAALVLLKK